MKLQMTKEQFTELFLSELTMKELEEKLGMREWHIRKYAKALNLRKKTGRPRNKYEFEE